MFRLEEEAMPAYSLNPHANEALYQQLYRHLREDISSGRLATGQRLPSKRRLSADLGISVVTVETALGQLAAEGWVKAKPRSGYYVCRIETANMPGAGEADAQALSHYTRPQPAAVSKQAAFPQLFTYDLAANKVSAETFPLKQWTRTVRAVMAQEPEDELIEAGDPCGSPLLRQAIASHLQDTRDLFVDPDCIVVGAGAQTLYNLLVQLLGRDRAYAVEDPGYPTLSRVYQVNGAHVEYLPVEPGGIHMDALTTGKASVAHVMPSHQFPTGRVMPVSERYDLLAWASETPDAQGRNRYIIEDDYDSELRLQGRPVPALKSIDALGRVIYANTFTRSLAPGLRIAYMVLPPQLMDRYRRELDFYSCTVPNITQLALARFIMDGSLSRHIARVRSASRKVRDSFIDTLQTDCPQVTEFYGDDAGLHFMMRIEGSSDEEVIQRAADAGIRLKPLAAYSILCTREDGATRVNVQHWFPVSFASLTVNQAHDAARRLAACLC